MIDLLTALEVGAALRCSAKTVYALQRQGKLVGFKLFDGAKGWRWHRQEVERFVAMRASVHGAGYEEDAAPVFRPVKLQKLRKVV